jgi:preprotein translocase subunit SecF
MFVVTHRKWFYGISGLLVAASLFAMFAWGLNLGIDFKGGSLLEVDYSSGKPSLETVKTEINALNFGAFSAQETGETGYLVRTRHLSQPEHELLISALSKSSTESATTTKLEEKRFNSIGPVLGQEAARKSALAIILVIVAIVLFITFAFRQVSEPVSSWKYGIIAVIALIHDVIVPTGAFAFLGHFAGYEIDTLFITALLVILGFSIHDTIVVFDRVRENLKHRHSGEQFEEIVGKSISQTFTRSINTSLTVLISLVILYFLGGEATQHFVLALIIGIAAGTYSSVFLGSPLLVTFQKWQDKQNAKSDRKK